jgi:transposase-like protein
MMSLVNLSREAIRKRVLLSVGTASQIAGEGGSLNSAEKTDELIGGLKQPRGRRQVANRRYNIKVQGQRKYLYPAIGSNGDTLEIWRSGRRNLSAAKRLLREALKRHGWPERIAIDGS